jgi:hypothetical protein
MDINADDIPEIIEEYNYLKLYCLLYLKEMEMLNMAIDKVNNKNKNKNKELTCWEQCCCVFECNSCITDSNDDYGDWGDVCDGCGNCMDIFD